MTPPRPTGFALDPKLQAVFDALDAYVAGTNWTSSNAGVTFDGGGTTHSMNSSDRTLTNSVTYTQRSAGDRVVVSPTGASLGPGETQQFTASAVDASGATIPAATFTWSISGGALGTIDATGLYTAPATVAAASTETVTAVMDGQNSWTSVTIQLHV
jgi:hypothetical protein